MLADDAIVADLNEAVDLRAGPDPRVAHGAPVDGAVRPDLHIVADRDAAQRMDPRPGLPCRLSAFAERRARLLCRRRLGRDEGEAVAAYHRVGLADEIRTDRAARADAGTGMDQRARTDLRISADMHLRADHGPCPDLRPAADHAESGDRHIGRELRLGMHVAHRVNAGRVALTGIHRRRKARQCETRTFGEDRPVQTVALPVGAVPHHRGARVPACQRLGIFRLHRQREMIGGACLGLRDARDPDVAVARGRQTKGGGDFC